MKNESRKRSVADKASRLSQFFEKKGFIEDGPALWLQPEHVKRFSQNLNGAEAKRLAALLGFESDSLTQLSASSLRFLDSLFAIGAFDPSRSSVLRSDPPSGQQFVNRLAEFQPELVGLWWAWRCSTARPLTPSVSRAQEAVINALSEEEAKTNLASLPDDLVASIIGIQPSFVDLIPRERWGSVAAVAISKEARPNGIIQSLSQLLIPSDVMVVIDTILDSAETSLVVSSALDQLVTDWRGPDNSDPVTVAIMRGHQRLKAELHSPWNFSGKSSELRSVEVWQDPLKWSAGPAFATASKTAPNEFGLELGFSLGVHIADREGEPSKDTVVARLKYLGIEPSATMIDVVLPMATLWATLRMLAKYEANSWKHDTELAGLRTRILSLGDSTPTLWAQSLEWILLRAPELDAVAEAVTLDLALECPEVMRALKEASHSHLEIVRLIARGILSLLQGIEQPTERLSRTLADAAARYMDGAPVFPYPLTLASTTWLGSMGVERAISNAVRRAAERFGAEVRDQGGDIEEALTKALVKELEVAFRETQPRLNLTGPKQSRALNPVLSVRQRPTSKKREESDYGCDLAWLLTANVRNRYSLKWVDLVQVKKSKALHHQSPLSLSRTDSWSVENEQLNNILKWSATATYWLIAAGGELLVVPAKHLLAFRGGTTKRATGKTFTIGYNDVRSAAIPLEQYLLDLLIGQWLGTSSREAITFVEGNADIQPRVVIEVSLTVRQANQ